jgi:hypothetical protein
MAANLTKMLDFKRKGKNYLLNFLLLRAANPILLLSPLGKMQHHSSFPL